MGISISHSSGTGLPRGKSKEQLRRYNNENKSVPSSGLSEKTHQIDGKQNTEIKQNLRELVPNDRQQENLLLRSRDTPSMRNSSKKYVRNSLEPIDSDPKKQNQSSQLIQASKHATFSKQESKSTNKPLTIVANDSSQMQQTLNSKTKMSREKQELNSKTVSKSPLMENNKGRSVTTLKKSMRTIEVSRGGVIEKQIDGEKFLEYDWTIPVEEETYQHHQRQEKVSSMNLVLANKFGQRMEEEAEEEFWRNRRKVMREVLAGRRTNAFSDFPSISCSATLSTCIRK